MSAPNVKVAVQVRHPDGELSPREWLWATVVHEHSRGGIYCLLNTAFWSPFALGDLVTARRSRSGDLVVTGLHRRGGRTAHLLVFRADEDLAWIRSLAKQWAATGTWVEGGLGGGTALTVSVERAEGGRPTDADLAALQVSGRLDWMVLLADPSDGPDHPCFRNVVVDAA